jgi:zinc transport system substrate-binding protein
MKKLYQLVLLSLTALIIAGCSPHVGDEDHDDHEEHHSLGIISSEDRVSFESKPTIITTFYPIEEITKAIVQDKAKVELIVGNGVEPHSYEPTPNQLVTFAQADLFIGMGGIFESIEEAFIETNEELLSFDAAKNVVKIDVEEGHDEHANEEESHEEGHDEHANEEESHEEHDEHEGHNEFSYDPHVWLSINNMKIMTNTILENLITLAPEHEEEFRTNAQEYLDQLELLEAQFSIKLNSCEHNTVIVNHKAFGYIAEEYNFEQVSVTGFSPGSEPTPQTLQEVIDTAKEYNLAYVFSEGQLDPKVAQTIANDINGEVLELNPIKTNSEQSYISIMQGNLENLVTGLSC